MLFEQPPAVAHIDPVTGELTIWVDGKEREIPGPVDPEVLARVRADVGGDHVFGLVVNLGEGHRHGIVSAKEKVKHQVLTMETRLHRRGITYGRVHRVGFHSGKVRTLDRVWSSIEEFEGWLDTWAPVRELT